MGLFTKKKLTDAERQAWSAQLLEVRAAALEEWEDEVILGDTWDDHDAEYNRLLATEYWPVYGITAWAAMEADGLRPSHYRKYLEGEGMIVLADEIEDKPTAWSAGEVYWIINTHELDDNGDQIWGYQFVATSWKSAKNHMKDRVKQWDLENTRKTNQLWKDAWNRYYQWIALAILAIVLIIVLLPVAAAGAVAVALGESISVGLLATEIGAVLGSSALFGATKYLSLGENLFGQPNVHAEFTDALDVFSEDGGATIGSEVGDVPVFQPDGKITLKQDAPSDPSALNSSGAMPVILAAALALLLFI